MLVNLACGRNPWRQACADDDTFRAYLEDPTILEAILPLSSSASSILALLFAQDPATRLTLEELRAMVIRTRTYTTLRPARSMALVSPYPSPTPSFAPSTYSSPSHSPLPSPVSSPQPYADEAAAAASAKFQSWSYVQCPYGSGSDSMPVTPTTPNSPQSVGTPGLIPSGIGRSSSASSGSLPPTPPLDAQFGPQIVPQIAFRTANAKPIKLSQPPKKFKTRYEEREYHVPTAVVGFSYESNFAL